MKEYKVFIELNGVIEIEEDSLEAAVDNVKHMSNDQLLYIVQELYWSEGIEVRASEENNIELE